jgi:hypothetical protein
MNTTSRNLGESEIPFSEKFQDIVSLLRTARDLEADSYEDSTGNENTRGRKYLRLLKQHLDNFASKHGESSLTNILRYHISGNRMVTDDFWFDVVNDLIQTVVEDLKSGDLNPYDSGSGLLASIINSAPFGYSLYPKTPENLPIITALADAVGDDVDDVYAQFEP